MQDIATLRKKKNLTQGQLAEKSGLSIRTIQRIESGTEPKGYTLEALCKVLDIDQEEWLKRSTENKNINWDLVKLINLSSIPFLILPFGSLLAPLIFTYWKREINPITKEIISIQILWTVISMIIVVLAALIRKAFDLPYEVMPVTLVVLAAVNIYVVIKNHKKLFTDQALSIRMGFSFL